MISHIKYLLILTIVLVATALSAQKVAAAVNCNDPNLSAKDAITCGACQGSGQTNCASQNPQKATKSLQDTIEQIVNILSITVGIIAVIMILFGGFRYITSGGAADKVTSAKNTLLYAVIGLVVVAFAQFIVKFVLNEATNPPSSGGGSSSSSSNSASSSGQRGGAQPNP